MSLDLLELASKYTELKRVTATEYHGPCPGCGGSDRFIVKIDKNTYFCRNQECKKWGDVEQFLIDFEQMSFQDACKATGNHSKLTGLPDRPRMEPRKPVDTVDNIDRHKWQSRARIMAQACHENLIEMPELLTWLEAERGINRFTVDKFLIGFNPSGKSSPKKLWGTDKDPYIPRGLVLPRLQLDGTITGINIRQFKKSDNAPLMVITDPEKRYMQVAGGKNTPWLLSNHHAPLMVVESELDALLLWQELDLFVRPLAMLTASAKPDPRAKTGTVLYSMDFDQAGKARFKDWHSENPLTMGYPPLKGKDISEMFKAGVDLFDWLSAHFKNQSIPLTALNPYAHFTLKTFKPIPEKKPRNEGLNWLEQGTLPDHLYQSCFDVVTRWQMQCDDQAGARAIHAEYLKLWGNE